MRLTKYYAVAYAIAKSGGTFYGDAMTFKTPADVPTIANIIAPVLTLTSDSGVTAATVINITDDGGPAPTANITKRGVVYSTVAHPLLDSIKSNLSTKSIATTEGTGKGSFTSLALNLSGKQTYYLKAYATNSIGTSYSNEVSFTTPVSYVGVTTNKPTNITQTTALLNGLVNNTSGANVTEQGFVYGLTANPTLTSGTKLVPTGKVDSITVTGLTANTAYHVRAYATNQIGTNYGADVSFTTLPNITKFFVVGDYNGWTNSDAATFIISTSTSTTAQGYVYLTSGGIKLTTDHSWDNQHTFGDNGSGGLTNPGNNITVAAAGYYYLTADLSKMTYSLTLTTWGIIGDATAGGWGTQTNMTYYPATQVFGLNANLISTGSFKFRGTSDWNINYGSTAADGTTLDAGGTNIAVPTSDNYAITLNLSVPNTYTFRIDSTWGIIGDATPGGWSTDTRMTWDAVNNDYTVTVALLASGTFKFRANQAWTVNYGGVLTGLTSGGANIAVPSNGTYTITFNPWTLVGTLTQNKKK